MKHKALLMACVAALAMLAVPYMVPPAAAAEFDINIECSTTEPAITISWQSRGAPQYFVIVALSNNVVVHDLVETGLTRTVSIDYNTQYAVRVYTTADSGRESITCDPPPEAPPFTLSYTCGHRETATVSWKNSPADTHDYQVIVWDQNYKKAADTDGNTGTGKTISVPYDTTYSVKVIPKSSADAYLNEANISVNCPNHPPTVNAGPDQTVSVNWHVYLTGSGSDGNLDPLTLQWTCGPADLGVIIEGGTSESSAGDIPEGLFARQEFIYSKAIIPNLPDGTQVTCTLTASDGHTTSSDDMTITVQSSWDGSTPAQDQPTRDNPPPSDVPDDTPDQANQGGQSTTRTTGGGGGGTGSGSFFIAPSPSRSAPEPEEPEPYQPVLTNGTIPFVKFRAVPLNGTYWNGTTTTPFQCDIEPTGHGHVNMTGLTYLGMEPYHIRTSNTTHANATDTTPAVYNMTVHAVSTYNMTELGSHGALFHVAANDLVWSIYPDTIPVFRDLFDDTTLLAITQYGTVHWAAADGSCRAP